MTDFFALEPGEQVERLAVAGQAALRHWGVQNATLDLIKYRENAVFRIEHAGSRMALRLHRYGYHSDAELHSELQWIRALEDAGIAVPTVVPAESGDLFVKQGSPDLPGEVQVDLFRWIDGKQLGSVEAGISDPARVATIYETLGELAARVHNQAAQWQPPPGFRRRAWDAEGLAGEQPVWGRFWEVAAASPSERDLMNRIRDRIHRDLRALDTTPASYSMIHADFAPENLLVEGDRVRLIDFDDAGPGWHLFEIATSLYFIQSEPYFDEARDALINGYRRHRALSDEQLEQLPLHLVARGFTYVGWVHTRSETQTARELTPMLLESACTLAEDYLSRRARD